MCLQYCRSFLGNRSITQPASHGGIITSSWWSLLVVLPSHSLPFPWSLCTSSHSFFLLWSIPLGTILSVCSDVYISQNVQSCFLIITASSAMCLQMPWCYHHLNLSIISFKCHYTNLCFFGPGTSLSAIQLLSALIGQEHLPEHKIRGKWKGWSVVNITCCRTYSNQAS